MEEQSGKKQKQSQEKDFGVLKVDKGTYKRVHREYIQNESLIKKNIENFVKGELLKVEMQDGKKFYRFFDKIIYGEPHNSKGEPV